MFCVDLVMRRHNFWWRKWGQNEIYECGDVVCITNEQLKEPADWTKGLQTAVPDIICHFYWRQPHCARTPFLPSNCIYFISVSTSSNLVVEVTKKLHFLCNNTANNSGQNAPSLPSATKLRRLCFYRCLSFCPPGGGGVLSQQVVSQHALQQGEGGAFSGGLWRPGPRKQTATIADGTHPTGMYSCSKILLRKLLQLKENRSAENT